MSKLVSLAAVVVVALFVAASALVFAITSNHERAVEACEVQQHVRTYLREDKIAGLTDPEAIRLIPSLTERRRLRRVALDRIDRRIPYSDCK